VIRADDPITLRATPVESGQPKPSAQYGTGRSCVEDGCTTRLSRYTRSDRCWIHQPLRFGLARGERKRK
jgi:hypothetical protein